MSINLYAKPRRGALALASCSVVGLTGLLIFEHAGDAASFALAAVPLVVGLWAWLRHCRASSV